MMMRKIFTLVLTPFLLAIFQQGLSQDQVFISELADPSDDYTGRFVELYNPGPAAVDLSAGLFYLSRQSNGGTTFGNVALSGTLAAGATYVIGGSGFEAIYGFAPDLITGILTGNGDDAYYLFRGGDNSSGILQDIFGVPDTDGTGEAWEYTDSRALRLEAVQSPNTIWTASEWVIGTAATTDMDPGTHHGTTPIEPGNLTLTVVGDTVDLGQTLRVGVGLGGLEAGDEIIAWQFELAYDPLVMDYQACELAGTLSEGGTLAVNDALAGQLSVSYMHTQPLAGNGTILYIDFASLVTDTSQLILSSAYLNDQVPSSLVAGVAIVKESEPPRVDLSYNLDSIRYADTLIMDALFSAPMDAGRPVLIDLSGALNMTGLEMVRTGESSYRLHMAVPAAGGEVLVEIAQAFDIWDNHALSQPVSGERFFIFPFLEGDVNDDGSIQAYDAALALQHSVGMDPLPLEDPLPWENWRDSTANVDGNAGITAYDAGLILQFSAGLISSFPGSGTKSALEAGIAIEVDRSGICFYGRGALLGMNIDVLVGQELLGTPELLATDYLSAVNTGGAAYRIGLCTAFPREGAALCHIPVLASGRVELLLRSNALNELIVLDLETHTAVSMRKKPRLFPNPVSDMARLDGLEGSAGVEVCGIHGKTVLQMPEVRNQEGLDLSGLTPGLYFMHVRTGDESHLLRFIKGESK